jgi:hypothetical protein
VQKVNIKGRGMLSKFKKVLLLMVGNACITFCVYAEEAPYEYKNISLGMTANELMKANPSQFPTKRQSELGKEFGILQVLLTPQFVDDCGLMGGKDCYHVSAVLSQPETGSSVVQQINVSHTYRVGPAFDQLSPYLFVKFGEPRIEYKTKGANYFVWGGAGELLQKNQGVISFENLTGKYVAAEVLKNLFNDKVDGYRLLIVDTDLKVKSAAVLKQKFTDAKRADKAQ